MILRRRHGQHVFTINHDNKAGFLSFKKTLYYDTRTRVTELVVGQHVANSRLGLIEGHGDDDALSRGEAIGFDDDRCALLSHVREGGVHLGKDGVGRCRYVVPGKEILGERLAALELCSTRARAETGEALLIEVINNARNQWRLGTDHREGTVIFLSKGRQTFNVHRVQWDIFEFRFKGSASITRRDEYPGHGVGLSQLPGQRVLAPAAPHYQNVHALISTRRGINVGSAAYR